MNNKPDILFEEPWYSTGPRKGDNPLAAEWRYLLFMKDGSVSFKNERPGDEEIVQSNAYKSWLFLPE